MIDEIQITPIKPTNGLVAFASFVLDKELYLGSIGIFTKPTGGFRLVYPTKKVGNRNLNLFYPISRDMADRIEQAVIGFYEDVMSKNNVRYDSTNFG